MEKDRDNWRWDPKGGWHPVRFAILTMGNIFKKTVEDRIVTALSHAYESSRGRNVYFNNVLSSAVGKIDYEYMKSIFRKSGSFPAGSWKEIIENYQKTGQWGNYSTGHASNALVVVTRPDNGNDGIYSVCAGTAARGVTSNNPTRACPIFNETNAFWELKLAATPDDILMHARQKAEELIKEASSDLAELPLDSLAHAPLKALYEQADSEYKSGLKFFEETSRDDNGEELRVIAQAVRAMTRAQVRALQVTQALM
jgi:hypothetical protein